MTYQQIFQNVYRITESVGSDGDIQGCYLVLNEEAIVVIDTGHSAQTGREVLDLVTQLEREPREISHVLLTHSHPDHLGGLAVLKKKVPKVKIFIHENAKKVVEKGTEYVLSNQGQFPLGTMGRVGLVWRTPILSNFRHFKDVEFFEGRSTTLEIGDDSFIIQNTRCHSSDHVIIHSFNNKTTFIGDTIQIYEDKDMSFFFDSTGSPTQRLKVLDVLSRMKTEYLCPAHCYPIPGEERIEPIEKAKYAQKQFEDSIVELLGRVGQAKIRYISDEIVDMLDFRWKSPYKDLNVLYVTIKVMLKELESQGRVSYLPESDRWRVEGY